MERQQIALHQMETNINMFKSLHTVANAIKLVGKGGLSVRKIDKDADILDQSLDDQFELSEALSMGDGTEETDADLWEALLAETCKTNTEDDAPAAAVIAAVALPKAPTKPLLRKEPSPEPLAEVLIL